MLSTIGMVANDFLMPEFAYLVASHDCREARALHQPFPTRAAALNAYREAIATSIARGWEVAYQGPVLNG